MLSVNFLPVCDLPRSPVWTREPPKTLLLLFFPETKNFHFLLRSLFDFWAQRRKARQRRAHINKYGALRNAAAESEMGDISREKEGRSGMTTFCRKKKEKENIRRKRGIFLGPRKSCILMQEAKKKEKKGEICTQNSREKKGSSWFQRSKKMLLLPRGTIMSKVSKKAWRYIWKSGTQ